MRNRTSFSWKRLALLAVLCLTSLAAAAPADAADVAIVVRPDVPVDNLSFAELRRLFLGDRQFWSSNVKVTLLVRAPGARERDVVLKDIYQMSEAQFKQYWIAKVFRAEVASGPRIVYSNEMAVDLVSGTPGAVAFVDADHVPKGLKVLKINGLLPGAKAYPLH
jgi:ABC-type phosphate transport system substrate-binding protein